MYSYPIKVMDYHIIFIYFVRISFIIDFTVIVSSYFYLHNLEYRFEILNDFWKRLPVGLSPVPGEYSHYDIAMMVDTIRLLHAELSDILRIFSLGYGKMLLGYFVFNYINIMVFFFFTFIYKFESPSKNNAIIDILNISIPVVFNLQNIIFTMSIVIAASRVHDKVKTTQIFESLIILLSTSIPIIRIHVIFLGLFDLKYVKTIRIIIMHNLNKVRLAINL